MTIDEIKIQIFIDSEEVCGSTMIDTYSAQEHVERAYNKAIDTFSHELKELFNRETPRDIDENTAYFALDDVRMWIDVIAEQLKEGE